MSDERLSQTRLATIRRALTTVPGSRSYYGDGVDLLAEVDALESENARLRSQLSALREALRALRELPDSVPGCVAEVRGGGLTVDEDDDMAPHDETVCPDCVRVRAYREQCVRVFAQADAALASTEPGGETPNHGK